MSQKPRLFLFYGNDSWASRRAVKQWEQLFAKKHGEVTRYVIEADELGERELLLTAQNAFQSDSLFSTPKFILVKRLTSGEKGRPSSAGKALLELLQRQIKGLNENSTIVLWEEKALSASHPLLTQFMLWEEEGKAKRYFFSVPTSSQVLAVAQRYLATQGYQLSVEAQQWLKEHYNRLEKLQRLERRLKSGQELLEDERSWWLYQLLEGALVQGEGESISREALQQTTFSLAAPIGIFEVSTAISEGNFSQARRLLQAMANQGGEEAWYVQLSAALRWQLERGQHRLGKGASEIIKRLVEIEIITKNYPLPNQWLMELMVENLAQGRNSQSILPLRSLWLAHLSRS